MVQTGSIVVDGHGTKLAYTDTGAPSDAYTTIFAVHGMAFNSGTFEPVQALAKAANVRFVAVTRRNYRGSTPFTEEELKVVNNGPEEEKTAFIVKRGVELLTFMDKFLQEKKVPLQPLQEGKPGGIAIVGWSLGNTVTLSAIANIKSAAPEVQQRLRPLIHTLILHEASKTVLGHAPDPRNWVPWNLVDQTIPEKIEMPFFAWWTTAYFEHDDLSDRTGSGLEYHAPSYKLRPPTVYSIAAAGRLDILELEAPAKTDVPYQIYFFPQYQALYSSLYSKETRDLFPNMKVFYFGCENTVSFGPSTTWMIEDHDKEHGGGFIKAKLVKGINHFSSWDDPEITLQLYQDCIARTF